MQEAELMGLLRTLFIFVIVYYFFRFAARVFGPLLIKKAVHKMQQKAQKQYKASQKTETSATKEGETIIDKKPNSTNQGNNSVGEYVDFEEID